MESSNPQGMIEELKAAIAELESENGMERFVGGHGLQSRFFVFEWRDERLEIDFRLPYARVLSDEETQAEDAMKVGAAIRLAILLLASCGDGRLLEDGETKLSVEADGARFHYDVYDADGTVLDSGDDWDALIARLNAAPLRDDGGGIQIIWP